MLYTALQWLTSVTVWVTTHESLEDKGLAVVVIHYKNTWFSLSNMMIKKYIMVSWNSARDAQDSLTFLVLKQKDSWTIGSTLLLLMLWPLHTRVLSNQSL